MFLKAMRYWYNNFLVTNHFSEFAYLGDLSQYDLTEIKNLLGSSWKVVTMMYDLFQLVTWSNKSSMYRIYYTTNGEFVQIKEERWIKEHIKFAYDVKPEALYKK